jgi:hypothetical protein
MRKKVRLLALAMGATFLFAPAAELSARSVAPILINSLDAGAPSLFNALREEASQTAQDDEAHAAIVDIPEVPSLSHASPDSWHTLPPVIDLPHSRGWLAYSAVAPALKLKF